MKYKNNYNEYSKKIKDYFYDNNIFENKYNIINFSQKLYHV